MGEVVTVLGASGSIIAVTLSGAQVEALGEEFANRIVTMEMRNRFNISDLYSGESNSFDNATSDLAIIDGGESGNGHGDGPIGPNKYVVGDNYSTIIIGGYNAAKNWDKNTPKVLDTPVTVNSVATEDHMSYILVGSGEKVTYNAGKESGIFIGGGEDSPVVFNGNDTADNATWNITAGDGDNVITTGAGDYTVSAGTGHNTITLGNGNNYVNSTGEDTITSKSFSRGSSSPGYNSVTLSGGSSSDYHATVNLQNSALIDDVSSYNQISVGGNSTVMGGTSGNVTFNSQSGDLNVFTGGTNNTVKAINGDMKVVYGVGNNIQTDQKLTFLNGSGNTTITGSNASIFGANELNLVLDANDTLDNISTLFVGSQGNETLDGSQSKNDLHIFGNTIAGGSSSLVAIGGAGNDTMVAGTGKDTFTGGAGDNLFGFIQGASDGGQTVITDFLASKGNKIGLYGYGLDENSLEQILSSATTENGTENGSVVLNINGKMHIVLQGVNNIDELNINQFDITGNNNINNNK